MIIDHAKILGYVYIAMDHKHAIIGGEGRGAVNIQYAGRQFSDSRFPLVINDYALITDGSGWLRKKMIEKGENGVPTWWLIGLYHSIFNVNKQS